MSEISYVEFPFAMILGGFRLSTAQTLKYFSDIMMWKLRHYIHSNYKQYVASYIICVLQDLTYCWLSV